MAFDLDAGADSTFVRRFFGVEGPATVELGRLFVLVLTMLGQGVLTVDVSDEMRSGDLRAARISGSSGRQRRDVIVAVEAEDESDGMSSGASRVVGSKRRDNGAVFLAIEVLDTSSDELDGEIRSGDW